MDRGEHVNGSAPLADSLTVLWSSVRSRLRVYPPPLPLSRISGLDIVYSLRRKFPFKVPSLRGPFYFLASLWKRRPRGLHDEHDRLKRGFSFQLDVLIRRQPVSRR